MSIGPYDEVLINLYGYRDPRHIPVSQSAICASPFRIKSLTSSVLVASGFVLGILCVDLRRSIVISQSHLEETDEEADTKWERQSGRGFQVLGSAYGLKTTSSGVS